MRTVTQQSAARQKRSPPAHTTPTIRRRGRGLSRPERVKPAGLLELGWHRRATRGRAGTRPAPTPNRIYCRSLDLALDEHRQYMTTAAPDVEFWRKVSAELGISVETPFETTLPDGRQIRASALVRDFGAKRGMAVFADAALVHPIGDALWACGYGFSAGFGAHPDEYDRAYMIEILDDWGWSGDPARKPHWLP